jgi:hypothetical protein
MRDGSYDTGMSVERSNKTTKSVVSFFFMRKFTTYQNIDQKALRHGLKSSQVEQLNLYWLALTARE